MNKSFGDIITEMVTMPNVRWDAVWEALYETLYMTIISTVFTLVFGLILGTLLFLTSRGTSKSSRVFYSIVSFVVNLFRAIPFIILILLLLPLRTSY